MGLVPILLLNSKKQILDEEDCLTGMECKITFCAISCKTDHFTSHSIAYVCRSYSCSY